VWVDESGSVVVGTGTDAGVEWLWLCSWQVLSGYVRLPFCCGYSREWLTSLPVPLRHLLSYLLLLHPGPRALGPPEALARSLLLFIFLLVPLTAVVAVA
jgi:hypothetical protein